MSGHGILSPGDRLGKYRIEELIGRGGMGEVYRAVENESNLEVAIKVLRPEFLENNPNFKDTFLQEGQLACRISHPNVVRVIDASLDSERNLCYLVMEYVSGGSMEDLLRRGETLDWEWALTLGAKVAEALSAARHLNIVHRDIKPDNLMLTGDGEVKLADLGIAKVPGESGNAEHPRIVGTPAYISPEQCRDSSVADCRSDIYSLGVTLYEILTGKMAYEGRNIYETLDLVRTAPVPDPRRINPEIPVPVAALVMKMMAKNPDERPQTPEELLREMRALLDSGQRTRHRQVAGEGSRISARERFRLSYEARAWLVRGVVLTVLLIGVIILSFLDVKPWRAREIVPVDREKIEVISAQARHDRKEAARLRNELSEREKRLDPPPSRRLFDALFRDGDIAVTEKYLAAGIWSLRSGAEGDLARWFERQTGNYLAPPGSFSVKSTALLEEAGVRLDEADAMLLAQWATDVDPSRRGLAIGVLEQLLKLKTSRRCAPGAAVAAAESVRRQCMENPEFFVADSMMETDLRQLFVLLRSAECADGVDAVVVPAENTALKTLREIIAVTRPGN